MPVVIMFGVADKNMCVVCVDRKHCVEGAYPPILSAEDVAAGVTESHRKYNLRRCPWCKSTRKPRTHAHAIDLTDE